MKAILSKLPTFLRSRTFWVGLLTVVAGALGHLNPAVGAFITEHQSAILQVLGIVGIILRFDTDTAISLRASK